MNNTLNTVDSFVGQHSIASAFYSLLEKQSTPQKGSPGREFVYAITEALQNECMEERALKLQKAFRAYKINTHANRGNKTRARCVSKN